jgi:hypothetical protein
MACFRRSQARHLPPDAKPDFGGLELAANTSGHWAVSVPVARFAIERAIDSSRAKP